MSKKVKAQKPRSGPGNKGGKGGGGKGGGGKEKSALRGVFLGMLFIALTAGFFLVPVGGKTSFSHVLHVLGLEGGGEVDKAKTDKAKADKDKADKGAARDWGARPVREAAAAPKPAAEPAPARRAAAPARPAAVKVADNLGRRAPMESATAADDAEIDRLVRRRAGK